MLLTRFLALVSLWRPVFRPERSFRRALRQALGSLTVVGTATLTRILAGLGWDQQDWSADYRLQARSEWQEQALFDALLPAALAHGTGRYVPVALDDTRLKKTGKRIPLAFYQRDPLSPPFHVNLQWGLRFLQVSVLLPLPRKYNMNARAVPVRFVLAPIVKKPKRNASSEQRATVPLSATAAQLKPTSSPLARPLAPELGSGGCCRQTLAGGRGCPLL